MGCSGILVRTSYLKVLGENSQSETGRVFSVAAVAYGTAGRIS